MLLMLMVRMGDTPAGRRGRGRSPAGLGMLLVHEWDAGALDWAGRDVAVLRSANEAVLRSAFPRAVAVAVLRGCACDPWTRPGSDSLQTPPHQKGRRRRCDSCQLFGAVLRSCQSGLRGRRGWTGGVDGMHLQFGAR